ncbi:MAG: TraB/GumN family protein [Chitinophagaceae bacterium]
MNLNRTCRSILWLLLISTCTYSQPLPKTLLWRISGHGLQKPSYLYGTMHLNDKRLFKFGDSVYHAIEQSEGLAIEVNPDEMAGYYANQLFDQVQKTQKLTDVLKNEDFRKYDDALSKKFKKPAGEITTADIVKEKNKWMTDYLEKGEMPTFVDAYLYNIARRQGKWVGGIEDIADQAGLLEDMVDKSDIEYLLAGEAASGKTATNHVLEQMIDVYTSQDIEALNFLLNGHTSAANRDRLLIRRNVKMARRIDSLSSLRTMFLAIGAAHLPGDSGVIYLLRQRGFTVAPVYSSATIDEKDYHFKEVKIPWYPVTDAQGLYEVMMPGNPATIKLNGLIEMKFLMDIFNMAGYCSMAVVSSFNFTEKDSIYNGMAARMFQTSKAPPSKIIINDGVEGREFIQQKKGANLRAQIFLRNKILYCCFMSALQPANLLSADANKFFSSLSMKQAIPGATTGGVFTDSIMGISFTTPTPVTYNEKLSNPSDNGWKISAFTGTDPATGVVIVLYSREVMPGKFVSADSVIYNDFSVNLKKQYRFFQQNDKWVDGFRMERISGRHQLQPGLFVNALNILKNGRSIILVTISDSANLHAPATDSIFSTLRFIDHSPVNWQIQTAGDNLFSSRAPGPWRFSADDNGGKSHYYAYDTSTAITYSVIPDTLSKYYWAESDSAYWKYRIANNIGADTLVEQANIANGNVTGVELLLKEPQNETRYKRVRLLKSGDKLYKLFVSAEKSFLYNSSSNDFFNGFRLNGGEPGNTFILLPKTALLLAGLAGSDSTERSNAFNLLATAPFTERDSSLLQAALFKPYTSPYDTSRSTSINEALAGRLAALNLPGTITFVRNSYNSFSEHADTLKELCLYLLAKQHSKQSYTALADLIAGSAPRYHFGYLLTGTLADSLSLTASIYPALQQLAADTVHATSIARLANQLIDSGYIKAEVVKSAAKDFTGAAVTLLPALLKHDMTDYGIYQLVTLLGTLHTAAANDVLKKYLGVKSLWLRKAVAIEMLKNKLPVAAPVWEAIAADKETRRSLYTDLGELKKSNLFPARFLTQAAFAESDLYAIATDETDCSNFSFVAKKSALYNGKVYVFYLYKIVFEEANGPESYLGIAGGYSNSGKGLDALTDVTGIYYNMKFDPKMTTRLLREYIEQYEKNQKEAVAE